LAFILGAVVATSLARKENLDPLKIIDLCFYILLSAIFGSHIFYVIQNYGFFHLFSLEIFKIWKGGLVFYGGLISATVTVVLYLKIHHMSFWKTSDIFAFGFALGGAVGRWACFSAGCCYGKPTNLPWGIVYTHPWTFAPKGISLHPSPVYESAANLLIFLVLIIFRKRKRFDGQLFLLSIGLYSIFRFGLEFLRGDDRGHFLLPSFSTPQTFSVLILITTIVATILVRRAKLAG